MAASVFSCVFKKQQQTQAFMCPPTVLQTLEVALKKALKSDFEDICLGLLMTPPHFDASLFRKATHVNNSWFML